MNGPGQLLLGHKHVFHSVSKESVKDLIRYLRHEDETRDVRQQLGAAQILQSDLLPILTQHRQDKPLFDAVIRFVPQPSATCRVWPVLERKPNYFLLHCLPRLMVNLTQPALLCFGGVPKDPGVRHHFLQVLTHLQAYKEVRRLSPEALGPRLEREEGEGRHYLPAVPCSTGICQ